MNFMKKAVNNISKTASKLEDSLAGGKTPAEQKEPQDAAFNAAVDLARGHGSQNKSKAEKTRDAKIAKGVKSIYKLATGGLPEIPQESAPDTEVGVQEQGAEENNFEVEPEPEPAAENSQEGALDDEVDPAQAHGSRKKKSKEGKAKDAMIANGVKSIYSLTKDGPPAPEDFQDCALDSAVGFAQEHGSRKYKSKGARDAAIANGVKSIYGLASGDPPELEDLQNGALGAVDLAQKHGSRKNRSETERTMNAMIAKEVKSIHKLATGEPPELEDAENDNTFDAAVDLVQERGHSKDKSKAEKARDAKIANGVKSIHKLATGEPPEPEDLQDAAFNTALDLVQEQGFRKKKSEAENARDTRIAKGVKSIYRLATKEGN